MWEAKRNEQWEHTSWLIAAIYNASPNRADGSDPADPDEIHPFGGNRFDKADDENTVSFGDIKRDLGVT